MGGASDDPRDDPDLGPGLLPAEGRYGPEPVHEAEAIVEALRNLGAFVVRMPKAMRHKNLWKWVAEKIMTGTWFEAASAFRFARQVDQDARRVPKRKNARASRS
jgi:hypothetical protein